MTNLGNAIHAVIGRARVFPALLLILTLPLALHCGAGGDTTTPPPERPSVAPTSTPSAPDLVRISGGEGIRSDLVRVDFEIGGPTTSDDIVNVSFDVVISNTSLIEPFEYAVGDLFPDDPAAPRTVIGSSQVLVDRVSVSAQKLTGPAGSGDGVGEGDVARVLSITFLTLEAGSTTLTLANGVALDSDGNVIDSITFDTGTATITQP